MKIKLLQIGKTGEAFLREGSALYEKRLRHYAPFEVQTVPALKQSRKLNQQQQKEKEGEQLAGQLQAGDHVVLLDERGKQFSSEDFSGWLEKTLTQSAQQLVFVIGGPYGFSESIRERARESISLSKMTFSHQMVRLIFCEQLYRAFTILRNEPYHHSG